MRIRRRINVLTLALVAPPLVGCTSPVEGEEAFEEAAGWSAPDSIAAPAEQAHDGSPALVRADSCEDVALAMRGRLAEKMEERLQIGLEQALFAVAHSCAEWG